jgi:RNA polymerase sigma-70 factor (ECF subfamily)
VRNTAYTWLRKTRAFEPVTEFDEQVATIGVEAPNPEQLLLQKSDGRLVEQAMSRLPDRFREILVLRELEGLSYKQIADVMAIPMGTVMSTLSRARTRFRHAAADLLETHGPRHMKDPAAGSRGISWTHTRSPVT